MSATASGVAGTNGEIDVFYRTGKVVQNRAEVVRGANGAEEVVEGLHFRRFGRILEKMGIRGKFLWT